MARRNTQTSEGQLFVIIIIFFIQFFFKKIIYLNRDIYVDTLKGKLPEANILSKYDVKKFKIFFLINKFIQKKKKKY